MATPNPKKRAAPAASEPTKKSKRRKGKALNDDSLDHELGINTAFSRMDNQLLADHMAQKTSRFGTELSPIELSDITVSANAIQDTTSWDKPRTLENLPGFLESRLKDPDSLKRAPKKKGAPHTIIIAGAGLRAANIVRAVRKFSSKDNAVAKLFAKHMKLEEQAAFLKGRRTGICVGTPARLSDLIDNGSLDLGNLERLVVDASHIDQKKRGIMDMKDTMMPLARFLTKKEFAPRYIQEEKPLALIFY